MQIRADTRVTLTFTLREVLAGLKAVAKSRGQEIPEGTTLIVNGSLYSGHEGDKAAEVRFELPPVTRQA